MGIDINGNQVVQGGGTLTINTGVVTQVSSAGALMRPNNALFSANGSAAWIYLTANAWNKLTGFSNVLHNPGGAYNGSLSRFTAPVDGKYAFQFAAYILRDSATPGEYIHPSFTVNGSAQGGNVNTSYVNYRIRFHGYALGTYDHGNVSQNYNLLAGDFVEMYMYAAAGTTYRYYPAYSRFTGFMMG